MRRLETRIKRAERLANGSLSDFDAAFRQAFNSIQVPESPIPHPNNYGLPKQPDIDDDFFENLERKWWLAKRSQVKS